MKLRSQLKRFPSPASVGNRARDGLIIKPALNIHSATGRIERQSDSQPARQTDNQRERETETEIERAKEKETEKDTEGER